MMMMMMMMSVSTVCGFIQSSSDISGNEIGKHYDTEDDIDKGDDNNDDDDIGDDDDDGDDDNDDEDGKWQVFGKS